MRKSEAQKQAENAEIDLSNAFSKSLIIAAIMGIGSALALLGLFLVTEILPSGEAAMAYWRLDRLNLPISVVMTTVAPTAVFAIIAICLKRWQTNQWPFLVALIGLICPLVWSHGLTAVDIIEFDGALETGALYLPPYPVFWSSVLFMATLLCAGAIIAAIKALIAR